MRQFFPALANRSRFPGMSMFWAAAALPGVISLVWLLRVPSEPEAALFLGYSSLRLLLAAGVLVMVLVFSWLAWIASTRSPAWQRLDQVSGWIITSPRRAYVLLIFVFFLFATVLALLALMVSPAGNHSRFLIVMQDRAGVVVLWAVLILAQLSGLVYFTLNKQVKSQGELVSSLPRQLWQPLLVVTALVFMVALRVYTGILDAESAWFSRMFLFALCAVPLSWAITRLVNGNETEWVFNVWAGVLFVGGALVWAWFINYGEGPFTFHDWKEVSIPRLMVVQNAIRQGELPLHISVGPALLDVTDRYMGVPDLILAPQVLLLKWLEIGEFLIANLTLTYTAGFAGLIFFARRYKLSIISFTLLFLLFNFNGHITAHIAVGHFIWATAYFLLPWLIILIFRLVEGKVGWAWVLQTAVLLFVIFLHGGYHYLVYSLFLLGLIAVLIPRYFGWMIKAALFSVLLCAVRLFPLATNAETFNRHIGYLDGFRSILRIFESLLHVSLPNFVTNFSRATEKVGSWELTFYLGIVGAVFFIFFGIIAASRNKQNPYRIFLLPALGLLVLSLDGVYKNLLTILPVPPLTGERVAARFFLLAFLIVLALAVIEFQRWYERQNPSRPFQAGWVVVCLLLAHDLWQNFNYWQIEETARAFRAEAIDPTLLLVANHPDPEYTAALAAGAAVSLVTLVALSILTLRDRQRKTIGSTGTTHEPTLPDPGISAG